MELGKGGKDQDQVGPALISTTASYAPSQTGQPNMELL